MNNVLLVSHNSLSNHANNGKTLHSIFFEWEKESLAQLYFQDEVPESLRFKKFFRIRDVDIIKRVFRLNSECGGVVESREFVPNHRGDSSGFVFAIIQKLKKYDTLRRIFREFIYGTLLWRTKKLNVWINEFKPNAVFLVGSNYSFAFVIGRKIAIELNIPLFVYFTDDYILNNSSRNIFERALNSRLKRKLTQCVAEAKDVFVIGSDMAKSYEVYFGRKFFHIMNSIDFDQKPTAKKYKNKEHINIVYAGGLTLGRGDVICEFSQIAIKAALISSITVSITVYSVESPTLQLMKMFDLNHVIFRGRLSGDELKSVLNSADFLLHVESSCNEFKSKTKLSVSTKIPEYLSMGICLIAYGPSDISSINLIRNNAIGIVIVDSDSFESQVENLRKYFSNPDLCERVASVGCQFAFENFNSMNVRALIKKKICSANDMVS